MPLTAAMPLLERVSALEAGVVSLTDALTKERGTASELRAPVVTLTQERDLLRTSHERRRIDLELLKRRIFAAKAERVDSRQLELEFAAKLAALDALGGT